MRSRCCRNKANAVDAEELGASGNQDKGDDKDKKQIDIKGTIKLPQDDCCKAGPQVEVRVTASDRIPFDLADLPSRRPCSKCGLKGQVNFRRTRGSFQWYAGN
jgi:hypothetical protein